MSQVSLKKWHTMHADVQALGMTSITHLDQLDLVDWSEDPLVLGGGSNILFTKDLDRTVVRIATQGVELVKEDEHHAYIKAAAGENWQELINWCLAHNYGGLENLSLIPGTVGASPIQNIGAYGVELKDTLESVDIIVKESGARETLINEACFFSYRDSIFKNSLKDHVVITNVTFKLTKKDHKLQLNYGAIQTELDLAQIEKPTIHDVSRAVIKIRASKLPDPAIIGNCGSFFKNPVLPAAALTELRSDYPEIPSYPLDDGFVKIPAAWLIEKSGMKGYRSGDAGVYEKHALILVNHGSATGSEVWAVAEEVMECVDAKFSIQLVPEVNVL